MAPRKEGWKINNTRVQRVGREEGLKVPYRKRKKRLVGVGTHAGAMCPIAPNALWALDVQSDTTVGGSRRPLSLQRRLDLPGPRRGCVRDAGRRWRHRTLRAEPERGGADVECCVDNTLPAIDRRPLDAAVDGAQAMVDDLNRFRELRDLPDPEQLAQLCGGPDAIDDIGDSDFLDQALPSASVGLPAFVSLTPVRPSAA